MTLFLLLCQGLVLFITGLYMKALTDLKCLWTIFFLFIFLYKSLFKQKLSLFGNSLLLEKLTSFNVSLLRLDFTHHYSSIPEGTSRFAVSLDQALPLRGDILVSCLVTFCMLLS